ncbi:MAG: choice-of-anchor D domain-containing protein [Verrucomicrobiota bacterium]
MPAWYSCALFRRLLPSAFKAAALLFAASTTVEAAPNPPVHTLIDINTASPNPGSSSPKRMFQVTYTPFGTATPVVRTFFVASSNVYGAELWVTDGTAGGTRALDSLRAGTGALDPQSIVVIGSKIYFSADSGDNSGRELYEFEPALRDWRLGTGATDALKRRSDLNTASGGGSNPQLLTVLGGHIYFRAQTSTTGGAENFELYRWNPAVPATAPQVITSFTVANPAFANLTVVGTDKLFFTANDTSATTLIGNELYCYTVTGTALTDGAVTTLDVLAGTDSSTPNNLVSFDPDGSGAGAAKLFFQAASAAANANQELFSSDGTVLGTGLFMDIQAGATSSIPQNLFVHTLSTTNNPQVLYFSAALTTTDQELWKSEGTVGTTARLKDIRTGASASTPTAFFAIGDTVLFSADTGTTGTPTPPQARGRELWKTNGTDAGTVLVADIQSGTGASSPTRFTAVGSRVYFRATTTATSVELYYTDAPYTSAVLVRDIATGTGSSDPGSTAADQPQLLAFDATRAIFAATDGTAVGNAGIELYITDGTSANTTRISDGDGPGNSDPARFVRLGDLMYFTASTGANGRELYRSNGTGAGTLDISNSALRLGTTGSDPQFLTVWNNKIYFSADTGTTAAALSGTGTGRELWAYDPVAAAPGLALVSNLDGATTGTSPSRLIVFDSKLYFDADLTTGAATRRELYVYDGVSAPVRATTSQIRTDATDPAIENMFVFTVGAANPAAHQGQWLYWTADNGGKELYRMKAGATDFERIDLTDTAGGGSGASTPSRFFSMKPGTGTLSGLDVLFFVASNGVHGEELWLIDPADNTPKMLKNVRTVSETPVSSQQSSSPRNFIAFDRRLWFDADTGTTSPGAGRELWVSDGTEAGTVQFADIRPGTNGGLDSNTNMSVSADGEWLYLRGDSGVNPSNELYRTDGILAPAVVADVSLSGSSSPINLVTLPESVYVAFTADTGGGTSVGIQPINDNQSISREWWVTDGTVPGTQLVKDLNPNLVVGNETTGLTDPLSLLYSSDPNTTSDLYSSMTVQTGLSTSGGSIPGTGISTMFQGADGKFFLRALTVEAGRELHYMAFVPTPVAVTTGISYAAGTANLQGTADRQGAKGTYYFEWGTTSAYGNVTPEQNLAGGAIPTTSSDLPALAASSSITVTPGQTYHFRMVVKTLYGTDYGDDVSFLAADPDIGLEQPTGSPLVSTTAVVPYGTALRGGGVTKTFTVTNTGMGPLSGLNVSITGTDPGDFVANVSQLATGIPSGGSTTFAVTFSPTAAGPRAAILNVGSSDPDENPFVVNLTGDGITTFNASFNAATDVPLTAAGLNASGLTLNLNLNFVPPAGTNLTVVSNTATGAITGLFSAGSGYVDANGSGFLENGELVTLNHNGVNYEFIAWYYGGPGNNDLVLLWRATGLVGWGSNADGRLGLGNVVSPQAFPVQADQTGLLLNKTLVQLSVGGSHSLALTTEGRVYSWGLNTNGRLGDNSTTTRLLPVAVDVSGVLASKTVVGVAAGTAHSLAVTSDGQVFSWGLNTNGQLGNNSTTESPIPVAVDMTGVLSGKFVVAVAAGNAWSMALTADGQVYAWGLNTSNQLGDNTATQRNTPVAVDTTALSALSGKVAVAIVAGTAHALALTSEGQAVAWGLGTSGQLGASVAVTQPRPVFVSASGALSGKTVVGLAAGNTHSMALTADGLVFGWGQNSSGQLGLGNLTGDAIPNTIHRVPVAVDTGSSSALNGKTLMAVNAGINQSRAVDSNGKVYGWGVNTSGEVGDGGVVSPITLPEAVDTGDSSALQNKSVMAISPGSQASHILVTYAGTPAEIDLQYPPGSSLGEGSSSLDFGTLPVGAGLTRIFTIQNTGGSVLAGISVGTLTGNTADFSVSAAAVPALLSPGASATFSVTFNPATTGAKLAQLVISSADTNESAYALSVLGNAGSSLSHTFNSADEVALEVSSLTATGTPLTLNLGFVPQPGTNLTVVRNTGVGFIQGRFDDGTGGLTNGEVVTLTYNGQAYNFVAWYYGGQSNNDLVLLWRDTNLAAWGTNAEGRLGTGASGDRTVPTAVVRTGVLAGKTIVSVATGSSHTLALATDGRVYAWGLNSSGQLGDGSATARTSPVAVDVGVSSALNGKVVVAIAAGSAHSLALTNEGKVYAWGAAASGALGDNQTASNRTRAVAVLDGAISFTSKQIVEIAAGTTYSMALDSTGKVYTWGLGTNGQLGDNTAVSKSVPVAVDTTTPIGLVANPLNGKTVVAISAGAAHAAALTSEGMLGTWGVNSSGQLGDASTTQRNLPAAVDVGSLSALSGKKVAAIATGSSYCLVLDGTGTAYVWGAANNGRLGNNTTTPNISRAILLNVGSSSALNGKTVKAVATGGTHGLALTTENVVTAWGGNGGGQVGNETIIEQLVPVNVATGASSELAGKRVIGLSDGAIAAHSLAIYAAEAEITVEEPVGNILADGVSEVDFGGQLTGQAGTPRVFTIRNDGTATLTGLAVSKTGLNSGDFSFGSLGATSLAPGAVTTFSVTFTPGAPGDREASISIASNDFDENTFDIAVTGKGTVPEIAVFESAVSLTTPASIDFGPVPSSGSTKTFTIQNIGEGGLGSISLSLTAAPGIYSVNSSGTATSLAPGATTTFNVTFTPSGSASLTGSVQIGSTDADENPFVINLTGTLALSAPINSSQGDVVSTEGAPDALGTGSVGDFNVLRRGGFISENGLLVFPGTLAIGSGSPAVTAGNSQGIWKDDGAGVFLLARTGTLAPGTAGASFATLPEVPAISETGEVTLLASLNIGVGDANVNNDTGIWSEIGGTGLDLLLREGDEILPGIFVDKFASGAYATAQISPTAGEAAFSISMRGASTNTAIVRTSVSGGTTSVSVVARQAQAAPGLAGLTFAALNGSYSDPARMDALGNLAFTALLSPGNLESLWYQPQGSVAPVKVFAGGDAAPGTTSTFSKIQPPSMGGSGVVSFRATLNLVGDNASNQRNDGIWRGDAATPASFTCILRRGDNGIPGLPAGSRVGNPWGGWLSNNNRGAWRAWIDMNGDFSVASRTTNDVHALFADTSGTMTMVIKEGDAAPGVAGAVLAGFDHPVVGGQDQMAFLGTMKIGDGGVTTSNDTGLWKQAPNGGPMALFLREGQVITTSVGAKTIAIIDLPGSGSSLSLRRWEQPVMDSTGALVVLVTFTDGSTSQFIIP